MNRRDVETMVELAMETMSAQEVVSIVKKRTNRIAAQRLFARLSTMDHDFEAPLPPPSQVKLNGRNKWMNWLPDSSPYKQAMLPRTVETKVTEEAPQQPLRGRYRRSKPEGGADRRILTALGLRPPQRNRIPRGMSVSVGRPLPV